MFFSKNNPYAPYANYDETANNNAISWEMRIPALNIEAIKNFNKIAEKWYWTSFTLPEKSAADCGAYNAKKGEFAITGLFRNYGTNSSNENVADFSLYYYDSKGNEQEYYIGTSNNLEKLMELAEKIRQNFNREQIIDFDEVALLF